MLCHLEIGATRKQLVSVSMLAFRISRTQANEGFLILVFID